MTFFNASKDFDIENIKITLSSAENAFTPVSSSNTFYISGIAANSSVKPKRLNCWPTPP